MAQTATTGQLANAQRIIIAEVRYTTEHNAAAANLFEMMTLENGAKQVTVPKVGQFEFQDLIDGVDLEDEQEIGMSTVDLTSGEVGAKIILTDKLARQEVTSPFTMVGRQFGDGAARKMDKDVIALFAGFTGGNPTPLGSPGNKNLTMTNWAACIAFAKAHKFPFPIFGIHHPNAVYSVVASAAVTPSQTYPIPNGFSQELLSNFYKFTLNQVPLFEDGNIEPVAGQTYGYGFIGSKSAAAVLKSKGWNTERERDASLRATELVTTADYGCFELDDLYGAPLQYIISDPSTAQ